MEVRLFRSVPLALSVRARARAVSGANVGCLSCRCIPNHIRRKLGLISAQLSDRQRHRGAPPSWISVLLRRHGDASLRENRPLCVRLPMIIQRRSVPGVLVSGIFRFLSPDYNNHPCGKRSHRSSEFACGFDRNAFPVN
ncbi:hypothetical protein J6590_027688 [Homalodisca vitripennis]|nr:hypothetical protein J6590_027688 [Homalodisca vitripennis]